MRRDTWFKCDPTDLIEGVETCRSPTEAIVYVVVIMRIYQSGGPIVNNPAVIGAICHVLPHHASRAIKSLIGQGKLTETPGGKLFNRRADHELNQRRELSETRSKAGKSGGRPRAGTIGGKPEGDRRTAGGDAEERFRSGLEGDEEVGKRQKPAVPEKQKLSPRAREEKEIREESPQAPQGADPDGQTPGPDEPLTADQRAELAKRVVDLAERPELPEGTVARVMGEIMRRARMTAPPTDLVLVESWLANGIAEELILETVTRMAGGAKSPVRAFRYFDAEIRRQHEAHASSEDAEVAEFRRIAARAQGP